jgi:chromosome partitioning protein
MAPRVIAITNQKGGVGKSTTALNLGAALVEHGGRALLVDLDPHAGLTFSLGFNEPEERFDRTVLDVLNPKERLPLREAVTETQIKGLDLVPSHKDLVRIDYELAITNWAWLLHGRIRDTNNYYDYVLLDCPPSLGILTRMAIVAADLILVPVQAEWLALRGLQLLHVVVEEMIQPTERDDLDTRYLVTMQQHTRHGQEIQDEIREHFGDKVFKTVIRRSIRFADSTIAGQPLLLFDKDHKGAQAYRELAQEIRSHGEANVLTGQG